MAHKSIHIRIFYRDQLVDSRAFERDVIKIGRLHSSHLRLDDAGVGRMHAVLETGTDGQLRVIDLGSNEGTKLNGRPVAGNAAVASGDVLTLGGYRLELRVAEAREPERVHHLAASAKAVAASPSASSHAVAPVNFAHVERDDGHVAEVVASYERSIVDVAHVGQASDRRRSAIPLLAVGGLFVVGGLGLFGYEVAQPWEAYAAERVAAQQAQAEAPEAPGLGTGSLGMVLALLGLVPLVAGGLRLRDQPLDAYSIGESGQASFKVSGDGLSDPAAMPIVRRLAEGFALAFTTDMKGRVQIGEAKQSLAELIESGRAHAHDGSFVYPLPAGASASLEHAGARFDVRVVKPGAAVASRGEVDWPFWGYFGGAATLATAFYLLMRSIPDDALAIELAEDDASARFASYIQHADEIKQEEAVVVDALEPTQEQTGGKTGKRARSAEGQAGNPSSKRSSGHYSMKGPKSAVPQMARDFDPSRAASQAGILGIIAQQDGHFMANVDGGAFAVGNDDADFWGNMMGPEAADSYGVGGLGLIGTGRGGGNDAAGLIGMSRVGLLGHGPGDGGTYVGPGGDSNTTSFTRRKRRVPIANIGRAKVDGDIDRDLIRRIVRSHINEVRSCYNAGLTRNPNLSGRVMIQFSIVGSGKVGRAVVQQNTTKDKSVANCIAQAVKRWKFPRTGNGGTALVSYPFKLSQR